MSHKKNNFTNQVGKMYENLILITLGFIILFLKLPFLLQDKYWLNGKNNIFDIILAFVGIVFLTGGLFLSRHRRMK